MNTNNTKQKTAVFPFWKDQDLQDWVDCAFGDSFQNVFNSLNLDSYPTDQYWDKSGNLNLEVPLAGYKKEDISLSVEEDNLVLSVKKHERNKDVKYVQESIRKKELVRKWYINDTFETSAISTSFVDGLLRITLPVKKPEEKKSKKINIAIS